MPETDTLRLKERIDILLKEYDTLRSEILVRTSGAFQLIAISVALVTWLINQQASQKCAACAAGNSGTGLAFWPLLAGVLVLPLIFFWVFRRDITLLELRIRELENAINALAGETLLQWENRWGAIATGWVFRRKPKGKAR